jgi:hypothetical protein
VCTEGEICASITVLRSNTILWQGCVRVCIYISVSVHVNKLVCACAYMDYECTRFVHRRGVTYVVCVYVCIYYPVSYDVFKDGWMDGWMDAVHGSLFFFF